MKVLWSWSIRALVGFRGNPVSPCIGGKQGFWRDCCCDCVVMPVGVPVFQSLGIHACSRGVHHEGGQADAAALGGCRGRLGGSCWRRRCRDAVGMLGLRAVWLFLGRRLHHVLLCGEVWLVLVVNTSHRDPLAARKTKLSPEGTHGSGCAACCDWSRPECMVLRQPDIFERHHRLTRWDG